MTTDPPSPSELDIEDGPPAGTGIPARFLQLGKFGIAAAALAVAVNVVVLAGLPSPPYLWPLLGFTFLVVQPTCLLYGTSFWVPAREAERLGYSLAGAIFILLLSGLLADLVLPLLGVSRPLDAVPIVLVADVAMAALYFLRYRFPGQRELRPGPWAVIAGTSARERRLICGSALAVVLAVLGANRLNNGAGDEVSLAALAVMVLTAVALIVWRDTVRETLLQLSIYLQSLCLLLMTSLRGWSVTGHDIQTEYQVFALTQARGRWTIASLHNAYNACLSITILPTELFDITKIDGPYVYKFLFQLLFVFCPVLVYTIARRYWSVGTAVLAAIYFVSFPTFFTDMPFINRQEIALLFVCVAVLVLTNYSWSAAKRRVMLVLACVAIETCHYSSMYILLVIIAVAWVVERLLLLWESKRSAAQGSLWGSTGRTVGIGTLLIAVAVFSVAWGFLATRSSEYVVKDAKNALSSLSGHRASARSSNLRYSFLFGHTSTPTQILLAYNQSVIQIREATETTSYLLSPSQAVDYPIRAVATPNLPLTGVGRLLSDLRIHVAGVNSTVRFAAAESEQLFLLIGLLAFLFFSAFRKRIGREFVCLTIGSVAALAIVTIIPSLSVDYGILRVFQEALVIVAPIIASGSLALFRPLGDKWGPRVTAGVALVILVSTTGLGPQLIGGYPAQLNLNNSGQYYTTYYVHPQEVTGVAWLAEQTSTLPANVQATHEQSRFLYTTSSTVDGAQFIEDAYPTLLRTRAYVIADYSMLHTGLATESYDGDIVYYDFPIGLLDNELNLVYSDGGMEIFTGKHPQKPSPNS